MASRRIKLLAGATTIVVGAGAYFLYSVMAVQGQGTLAQAPLNVQVQTPPAFIMAVDDSGSMTFEVSFAADEQAYWGNTTACLNGQVTCLNGFFNDDGTVRTSGLRSYYHLIQNGIRLDKNGNGAVDTGGNGYRLGIPPLDLFGFARSPDYNGQYFDPEVTYTPWQFADATFWPNAPITAARSDPRLNGSAGVRGPNPVVAYDFTSTEARTDDYFAFRMQPGMRLPGGTEYFIRSARHGAGCGGLGITDATRNAWVTIGAGGHLVTTQGNITTNPDRGGGCEVHIKYFPAVVYLREVSPPVPGFDLAQRVLVPNAGGPGVALFKYELRPENFTTGYAEVIQNFANWYTYYGNRNRAMVTSMTQAVQPINNMRIGYFAINKRTGTNPGMASGNVLMRDMAQPSQKVSLYDNLFTLPADGGTPNRSATVYMGDQFKRTDAAAPVRLVCQKNAGMLFTDGYTNEGGSNGNVYRNFGDTDSALPPPLGGNPNGNTIADIAYSFYANNLVPTLTPAGRVPVPQECVLPDGTIDPNADLRLDCQRNLHMNFYGVTLGTPGLIHGVNAAATADPYTTFPNWSVTGTTNLNPRNVDDMWHAAINTRGEYINAKRPTDVTSAMRRILALVSAGASPSGSIALTGARVGTGSLAVVPFYEARNNGTDWYSTLTAQTVSVAPGTGVVTFPTAWEATTRFPTGPRAGIWYGRGNVAPALFTAANISNLGNLCNNTQPGMSLCTGPQIAALGGTPALTLDQALDYLKGDQSLEVERTPAGKLRFRTTVLGDIVNSTPVVSAPTDDFGYRGLPAPYGALYNTYLTTTKATRRPMVFAGANDGMLHGFDGRTGPEGGRERFAFIPQSVMGHMGNLLFPYQAADAGDQKFKHRYYVDGPVAVSDAYDGTAWKTVLVGSTGAGARGVFGLDVSGVSGLNGSFAAADRLWEISDLNTSLAADVRNNIGHVLGRSVVVPVKTGSATGPVTWRAIFGNGYNSQSGKAVLYMVDIGTGAPQVRMLEAREAAAPVAGSNGLGNIVVVDRWGAAADNSLTARTRDGFADTVYAADQKGAIWKFDLRDATPVNTLPTVANQTIPVFTTQTYTSGPETGTRQPIIGGLTAAQGPGGGVLVYFGTGSFSFEGDPTDNSQQSLYAVLDTSNGNPTTTVARSDLLQQTVGTTTGGTRSTSSNVATVLRLGWYLDLPLGERFVGYPRVESGLLFMPTYAPTSVTACSTAGVNWLYGLNALSGAAGLSNIRFDSPTGTSPGAGAGAISLNTQGTAPVKEVAVLTTPRPQPLGTGATPAQIADALAAQCSMVIQVAGAPTMYLPRPCGRQSWRQIQ